MSKKVHLYSSLQRYTGGYEIVEVEGQTIGECLNDLVKQYPLIKPAIFNEENQLLKGVFVSINLESPSSEKLTTRLKNNDDLYLILIVAGG